MLAEFEFSDSATITIKERQFTKHDVLQFFEQLEQADDLNYHLKVAGDKVLLQFLEDHTIAFQQSFLLKKADLDEAFIAWLSPFFTEAFSDFAFKNFRDKKLVALKTLLANDMLTTDADAFKAWDKTERHFQVIINHVTHLHENNAVFEPDIEDHTDVYWIELVNQLPQWRFADKLNDYAFELMQLAIVVFNKNDRQQGLNILATAKKLQVDEVTMQTLVDKEEEMNAIVSNSNNEAYERTFGRQSQESSSLWPALRIAGIVIFLIIRLAIWSGRSSNSYSADKFTYLNSSDYVDYKKILSKSKFAFGHDTALVRMLDAVKQHETTSQKNITRPGTGEDPYKKLWKKDAFGITTETVEEIVPEKVVELKTNSKMDTTPVATTVEALPYTQPLSINNKSKLDAIVFVVNKQQVCSYYIRSSSTHNIDLPAGYHKVYVYAGTGFSKAEKVSFTTNRQEKETVTVNGLFTKNTDLNKALLKSPLYLLCRNNGANRGTAILAIKDNTDYTASKVDIGFATNESSIERLSYGDETSAYDNY